MKIQQGQRVYVTEVVADNFQMLESRAAREGHSGGSYNAGGFDNSNSFGGGASTGGSFGGSQPAQSTPNFGRDESPFWVIQIQWIFQMTISHSKNGQNELNI